MPGDEIKVGDVVGVTLAGAMVRARVVEDRGNIGVGGRRLLGIEVLDAPEGQETRRFEVPAERVKKAA